MGLFGKKKYDKNITRDNEFLKEYAIKCNGLMFYVGNNENVKKELALLKDDFQYTVATADKHAKKSENDIEKMYDSLKAMLQQPEWDEMQVLAAIRNMGAEIDEINAMRK